MGAMQEGALAVIELRLTRWEQVRASLAQAVASSVLPQIAFAGALAAACIGSFALASALVAACASWVSLVLVRAVWLFAHAGSAHGVAGATTLTFFAGGYLVEGSTSITFHHWSDVARIERDARGVRLMHDRGHGHFVGRSVFPSHGAFELMSTRIWQLWRCGQSRETRRALALPAVSVLEEIRFEQTRLSARQLVREQLGTAHPWLRPLNDAFRGAAMVLLGFVLFTALRTGFLFGCFVAVLLVLTIAFGARCARAVVSLVLSGLTRATPRHKRGPVRVALAEEGVVYATRHSLQFVPWTSICDVRETPSFVVLQKTRGEPFSVPKAAFAAPVQAAMFAGIATRRSNGEVQSERRFSTHPPPAMA
jgi:hypothetical protein